MRGAEIALWLLFVALLASMGAASSVSAQTADRPDAASAPAPNADGQQVADGVAISPDFAKELFSQVAPLQEADGCRLIGFDTLRVRIRMTLLTPSGERQALELATAPDLLPVERRVGEWAVAIPAELERQCGATVGAIVAILDKTAAPSGWLLDSNQSRGSLLQLNPFILAGSFLLVVVGTLHILYREMRRSRPAPAAVAGLVIIAAAGLALRLYVSPRTFLHEYYHIAETVPGYLAGEISPTYGKTGPTMFRLFGVMLGRSEDIEIIFLTTAILSSLAIPALALVDLTLMRNWPRALCAAMLLAVLPQHLRFSAAEDLFVQAVTFGLWSLALAALYVRTRRLADVLICVLALSLAMQARPEMLFFPAVLVTMVLLVEPRSWRVLIDWRTLVAFALLALLLVPRVFELQEATRGGGGPSVRWPHWIDYKSNLVALHAHVTPPIYWVLGVIGLMWGLRHRPGFQLWALLVSIGYTTFALSIFNNPPWNVRSQILPVSFLLLIAAGVGPVWMGIWGRRRQLGVRLGAVALAVLGTAIVLRGHGFVTELRDQQFEWLFLERTVAQLPDDATLLSAVNTGGRNLDAFPEFLLRRANKTYRIIDVRDASRGEVAWPAAGDDLIFYQGMFCYFAFHDEPKPNPMSPPCQAVRDRYVMEPLIVESLDTQGYSALQYAPGPYEIGFFRLVARSEG